MPQTGYMPTSHQVATAPDAEARLPWILARKGLE